MPLLNWKAGSTKKEISTLVLESSECFALGNLFLEEKIPKSWNDCKVTAEQFLPLDAEELCVTAVSHRLRNASVLLLAVNKKQTEDLILAEDELGLSLIHICVYACRSYKWFDAEPRNTSSNRKSNILFQQLRKIDSKPTQIRNRMNCIR